MRHEICMICRKKNDTHLLDKLRQMERLLQRVEVTEESRKAGRGYTFSWFIHLNCDYGIGCPQLEQRTSEARRLASNLEPRLVAAAISDNARLYHEILRYLQGDFPAVYRLLERIHATNTRKGGEQL